MRKFANTLIALFLVFTFVTVICVRIKAETHHGITLTMDKPSKSDQDEITFTFESMYKLNGNFIGFKVNSVSGIKNGGKVKWQGFRIYVYDENNKEYAFTQTGVILDDGVMMPSFDQFGNYGKVAAGGSVIYPLCGDYVTVYMPYELFLSAGSPITQGTKIKAVKIKYDTREGQRDKAKNNIFGLYDGTLKHYDVEKTPSFIGDVRILEDFNSIKNEYALLNDELITDFGSYEIGGSNISLNKGAVSKLTYIEEAEYQELLSIKNEKNKAWKTQYGFNGQHYEIEPVKYGDNQEGLAWQYGDYSEEYDSLLNSYGSLQITPNTTDWKGALGITLYVKNYQPYPSSFNIEFQEVEDGGVERWNLNNDVYRKVYAYDVNTGEEFAIYTLTVCHLPANFEGWVRIPFEEFTCPAWSLAYAYTDGEFDLNKEHNSVFITSQFVINDGCRFLFDSIGLYYEDFQVGKLFDRTKPSIKECLEMEYNW